MDYRAYLVGNDGHFKSFKAIIAEDDKRAIEIAQTLVNDHDVELWQLDRKIVALPQGK